MLRLHDPIARVASVSGVSGPAASRPTVAASRPIPGDRVVDGRDRFLDLVRVVAIVRVLVIHGAATTSTLWWPVPSWILPGMPLVFFTAGALAEPSLRRTGAARFHRDRLRRLLVPYWAVLAVGLATLVVGAAIRGGDRWTLRPHRLLDAVVPIVQPRVAPVLTDLGTHLWFASTFVVLIALTPALVALHRRRPLQPMFTCVALFVVLNTVDRLWVPVPIEVLHIPMYGIFLCAGFGYSDGTLVDRPDRPTGGRVAWLRPSTAAVVVAVAVAVGWTAFLRGTRDLNHDLVGHTCVAAGWLVAVLALRTPLRRIGTTWAHLLDRITPRTLTLYLWGAPAGVVAWRIAEHNSAPAGRLVVYITATVLLTAAALAVFGRLEDLAAGRRVVTADRHHTLRSPRSRVRAPTGLIDLGP